MAFDPHTLFAYSKIVSVTGAGPSYVCNITTGDGARFAINQNVTIWPLSTLPTITNATIARITAITTDAITVTVAQEGSAAVAPLANYQFALGITPKLLTDIEALVVPATFATAGIVKQSIYNVREYGAVGDGTTDDTAAIQAAENAAVSGGRVYFPAGIYIVTTITKKSLTHWRGAGIAASVLKLKNTTNADLVISENFATLTGTTNTAAPYSFSIKDMSFDGNAANNLTAGTGIKLYARDYILSDIRVYSCRGDGIYTEYADATPVGLSDSMECFIFQVKSHDNYGWNFNVQGPHDGIIQNCIGYMRSVSGVGNFQFIGNSHGFLAKGCHSWGTPTGYAPVILGQNGQEWSYGVAEVLTGHVGIQVLGNDCVISGGSVYDPVVETGAYGIQIGSATKTPSGTYVDTKILGCNAGSLYFFASGGNNTGRLDIYQTSSAVIAGTPTAYDDVELINTNIFGTTGPLPQRNASLTRALLPDPSGITGWYKLGTWKTTSGNGGSRLRIEIVGTGGYNADINSVGRTVIMASTGSGTPSPNIQGVWCAENGNKAILSVKAQQSVDKYTHDIYVSLPADYTGNSYISVETGTDQKTSGWVYSLASGTDPGIASTTVAILTEQNKQMSPLILASSVKITSSSFATGSVLTSDAFGGATWQTATATDNTKVLKAGDMMTGTLNTQVLLPATTATYGIGSALAYYTSLFATQLNLNATAAFSGGTAGQINVTGNLLVMDIISNSGNGYYGLATGSALRLSGGTLNDGAVMLLGGSTHSSIANTGVGRIGTTSIWKYDSTGVLPFATAVSNLGGAALYWANLYATRHTFNATAYLDGATAGQIQTTGVLMPVQATTAAAPAYVKGGMYFDTTLNKLRIGGATVWETVTST